MITRPRSRRLASSLPNTPAVGVISPLARRQRLLRILALAGLLGLMLLFREADSLRSSNGAGPLLPPLPGAAEVEPGIVRGGQPGELDLVRLRDYHSVRSVIEVDRADAEERAVVLGLDMAMLQLTVADGEAPSAEQLLAAVDVVRAAAASRAAGNPHSDAYLHDTTGRGPVLVVAGALRLLHGTPLTEVVDTFTDPEREALTEAQLQALTEIAAVVQGGGPAGGRYEALRGVDL